MRVMFFAPVLIALAACGVDGPPERPTVATTVGVGKNGTHTTTKASVFSGNITMGVGVGL
ncbi:hypothetical protein [Roseovarius sp. ZX-A-9]|uniref:hypothetical protein n=1 Tax=Roseovarius sp. ZX-A-9 TaxID=3014783 RepID=UPI00232B69DE|nr:hypothetical protein [Roseovarius sp. ZX-A-9]